jgi:hypothetical protein
MAFKTFILVAFSDSFVFRTFFKVSLTLKAASALHLAFILLAFIAFFKVNLTLDAASALHRAFIHNDSYVFHLLQSKCYFTGSLFTVLSWPLGFLKVNLTSKAASSPFIHGLL